MRSDSLMQTFDIGNRLVVLVDDDPLVHRIWDRHVKPGIAVRKFHSPNEFESVLSTLPEDALYFLDCDFTLIPEGEGGGRNIGLVLAKRIRAERPHAYIHLVTGHDPEEFQELVANGLLNDVGGKTPQVLMQEHPNN